MLSTTAPSWFQGIGKREVTAVGTAFASVVAIALLGGDLSTEGRIAIAVFALAIVGWTMTQLGESFVALSAAVALVISGVVSSDELYATLGDDLVWLLVSAFIIAAVVKTSGLAEVLAQSSVGRVRSVGALFHGITLFIAATALVVPSTSGRAALLLPVFLALAAILKDERITRALALAFPTAILLTAGGSLIGAGAHLVAADFVAKTGHGSFDYLDWLLIGMPLALLSSHAATELILRTMLTGEERLRALDLGPPKTLMLDRQQTAQLAIVAGTVGLWMTNRFHGFDLAIVALISAVALTLPRVSGVSMKKAVKSVEWDLLLFLAATILMGQALLRTDADEWLVSGFVALAGGALAGSTVAISFLVATVAVLAHLVITSRTTRVTVLLPAFVLPVAALGHDPVPLILLTVFGTGFCQTMMASAKPVAIFGNVEAPTYTPQNLVHFSLAFMPVMLVLLMTANLLLWPALGIGR